MCRLVIRQQESYEHAGGKNCIGEGVVKKNSLRTKNVQSIHRLPSNIEAK
jgi:hypothetical protein